MVPYSKLSSKRRAELQISLVGAKRVEEGLAVGNAHFCIALQNSKYAKIPKIVFERF